MLCFYEGTDYYQPLVQIELDPLFNRTDDVWHCRVNGSQIAGVQFYSFRATSDPAITGEGTLYPTGKELLDPYARRLFFPAAFQLNNGRGEGSNAGSAVLGVLPSKTPDSFPWGVEERVRHEGDLLIYEMHVRGFTKNHNSGVSDNLQGTYLGVVEKIPYLRQLGVTAVELMPVFAFDPRGANYWGYMPISYFAPHCAYATNPKEAVDEFRQMVKALHAAQIEVILDVVFNHSAEAGADGPVYSLKGLDNRDYYLTTGSPPDTYLDFSGTGNTLNAASPPMQRLLLDSLRYWVSEMHVDGFRFDLASVLARRSDGTLDLDDPPIFAEIAADPILGNVRMIAEPWDASNGYLLGPRFPGVNWMQWNGRYRDLLKRFVRGEGGLIGELMTRVYGSDDLFPGDAVDARHPYQSVNYIVSHDGFTLYDTVAYNQQRNLPNGENNNDGPSENLSWNCGFEGDGAVPPHVLLLRKQQARNFFTLQMLSNGTPMIRMGDEFLQTQVGNSNPWNQDNDTAWLDWDRLKEHSDIARFVSKLIAFRNAHPCICQSRFWRGNVAWYGPAGPVDFSSESRALAYTISGISERDANVLVIANMCWEAVSFAIQAPGPWLRVIDTSKKQPTDIIDAGDEETLSKFVSVQARSVIVAVNPQNRGTLSRSETE